MHTFLRSDYNTSIPSHETGTKEVDLTKRNLHRRPRTLGHHLASRMIRFVYEQRIALLTG